MCHCVGPTSDTEAILEAALAGLRLIYQPGFNYSKAGVMLLDLQSDQVEQRELDWDDDDSKDRGRLMGYLDTLNHRFGRGTVKMLNAGLHGERRVWSMKQERRTPAYTTCWADMPTAKARVAEHTHHGILSELKRHHARRLREVYRSAGWPCQDVIEIELLAAGLLERHHLEGHDYVRVTDAGIQYLAGAAQSNQPASDVSPQCAG